MDRRRFLLTSLAGLVAAPLTDTESAGKVYRLGILGTVATSELVGDKPRSRSVTALLRGLRELGYVYGTHFVTEPRGSDGTPDILPRLAAELVRLQVDVIVAAGPFLAALKEATTTIPIVMGGGEDPLGQGLVQSLGRPGGNFTGLSNQSVEATGKRLELLKQLVPRAMLVAVLWDRPAIRTWQAAEAVARERGWKLMSLEVQGPDKLDEAFKKATSAGAGALLTFGGLAFSHTRRITELAARNRLPTMYAFRPQAEAGGLISYGPDIVEIWWRAAVFVDKILKGARPADLPIEQPTKFDLVINLKTAKALALSIPPSLLLRADHVIE